MKHLFSPKCLAFWQPTAEKQYKPKRPASSTLRLRKGRRLGVTTVKAEAK